MSTTAAIALATTTWFCDSGPSLANLAVPYFSLDLEFASDDTFTATGTRSEMGFEDKVSWSGRWTDQNGTLWLIGDMAIKQAFNHTPPHREARAMSTRVEPDVLMFEISLEGDAPRLVRCLTHLLR
ncbi:hypothetical protein [Tateyamaria sp. ANG-S1]|uniref:hypothetical protein n=1 Tax=Tateyamaria sp. ANG-S1 TaxID=1577905 RepID=UPI0005806B3F|nr:hypothetical protein [Tateyamaria sp. ANG-S1]KIC46180.1 hypothetical protein RA29_19580 [Tateyamaria sp. ANG-S1]